MKKWQAMSLVMLIFMIGVASGAQGTRIVVRHQVQAAIKKGPEGLRELLVTKLDRDLDLNQEQRSKVAAILADSEREFRVEIQPRIDGIVGRTELRIQHVLAPDQQKVFDRSIRERRSLWSKYDAKLALHERSGLDLRTAANVTAGAHGVVRDGAVLDAGGRIGGHNGAGFEASVTGQGAKSIAIEAHGSIHSDGLAASASLGSAELGQATARASLNHATGVAADAALALPGGATATAEAAVGRQGVNAAAQLSDPVSGAKLAPSVSLSRNDGLKAEIQARPGISGAVPQSHSNLTQRPAWNHPAASGLPPIVIPTRR